MKKILLLFDGRNFHENSLAFAQQLHLLSPITVTGLFAPVVSLASLWSYAAAGQTGAPVPALLEADEDAEVKEHIQRFEGLCAASRIPYRVHQAVYDLALPALRHESRFADLLILSGDTFYHEMLFGDAARYLRDALHDAECPVLVLPEKATVPSSVLVAYDGSRASVYAMKQFAYLFPEWSRVETTLLHSGKGHPDALPEAPLIGELAGAHFKHLHQRAFEGGREALREWTEAQPDALLVAGSFARSWLSELFRDSFAAELLRHRKMPVFIAHQ